MEPGLVAVAELGACDAPEAGFGPACIFNASGRPLLASLRRVSTTLPKVRSEAHEVSDFCVYGERVVLPEFDSGGMVGGAAVSWPVAVLPEAPDGGASPPPRINGIPSLPVPITTTLALGD